MWAFFITIILQGKTQVQNQSLVAAIVHIRSSVYYTDKESCV